MLWLNRYIFWKVMKIDMYKCTVFYYLPTSNENSWKFSSCPCMFNLWNTKISSNYSLWSVHQVADYHMALQRSAWVINGPSRGDSLTPFSWSQFKNTSHIGLPDVYNFDFVLMKPAFNWSDSKSDSELFAHVTIEWGGQYSSIT